MWQSGIKYNVNILYLKHRAPPPLAYGILGRPVGQDLSILCHRRVFFFNNWAVYFGDLTPGNFPALIVLLRRQEALLGKSSRKRRKLSLK